MKTHIIIGAGIGGLYIANRLLIKGVKPEKLIIIDPRAGRYTRQGHLNSDTFDFASKFAQVDLSDVSPANHIKELERALYEKLKHCNVKFIRERFVDLQEETDEQLSGVLTKTDDGEQHFYPADFVFDCTATKAHVAHAVNQKRRIAGLDDYFKSSKLVEDNPIPDHLVAQVRLKNSGYLKDFINVDTPKILPDDYTSDSNPDSKKIHNLERLKALGWPYEAYPTFYSFKQPPTDKLCLYMETPPDLPRDQHQTWIDLLLNIYSNDKISSHCPLTDSKKYPGEKPRIMGYKSEPYRLNKTVFESDKLPTILLGFDALKSFDYRLAHGVISGLECAERIFDYTEVEDGRILSLNAEQINQTCDQYILRYHAPQIQNLLTERQATVKSAYRYFKKAYKHEVEKMLPEHELYKHYQQVIARLSYKEGCLKFSKLDLRQKGSFASVQALNQCLSLFLKATSEPPLSADVNLDDAQTKRQTLEQLLREEIAQFDIEKTLSSAQGFPFLQKTLEKLQQRFLKLDKTTDNTAAIFKLSACIEQVKEAMPQTASAKDAARDDSAVSKPAAAPNFFKKPQMKPQIDDLSYPFESETRAMIQATAYEIYSALCQTTNDKSADDFPFFV